MIILKTSENHYLVRENFDTDSNDDVSIILIPLYLNIIIS